MSGALTMPSHGSQKIEWMTVSQAARQLGLSAVTVYRMIHNGDLPASRQGLGRKPKLLLDPADVRAVLRRRTEIVPVQPRTSPEPTPQLDSR
jgi:excisionase family DNA binding protein